MILGVTGHRPNKLGGYRTPNPIYNSVMEGLDRVLLEYQPERVITGMAMGVDQWMAELCVWNGVPFIAAIPFENFEAKWFEATKRKYYELLDKAAQVVLVCQGDFAPWKMQRRNEWIVHNCNVLAAVFDGTFGGTQNTVRYAREVAREIRYVDFLRPPPLVSNDRPVLASPVQLPDPPPPAVSAIPARLEQLSIFRAEEEARRIERETAREEARQARLRRQNEETEGRRAARRAALQAMEQEQNVQQARLERLLEQMTPAEIAEAVRQATATPSGPSEPHTVSEPTTETSQEEPKSVVPEFARFVDLDV